MAVLAVNTLRSDSSQEIKGRHGTEHLALILEQRRNIITNIIPSISRRWLENKRGNGYMGWINGMEKGHV